MHVVLHDTDLTVPNQGLGIIPIESNQCHVLCIQFIINTNHTGGIPYAIFRDFNIVLYIMPHSFCTVINYQFSLF